jgi:hypothetical protein
MRRLGNQIENQIGNPMGNGMTSGGFSRWRGAHSGVLRRPGALLLIATAATFGAGCGSRPPPPGYAGDDARAFVREHRAELEKEIATGSGPRIYDLAILANCQDVPELGRRLRARQDDFFSNGGNATEIGRVPAGAAAGTAPTSNAMPSNASVPDAEVAERVVRFMQDRREFRCLNLDLSRQNEFSAGRRHIGPRRSATAARGGTP